MRASVESSTVSPWSDFLAPAAPVLPPAGPVLVASDASAASDAAFPIARALAQRTGAAVQVVSAIQPTAMPTYAFDAMPIPTLLSPAQVETRTSQLHAQLTRVAPDVEAHALWPVTVRSGDPIREIVHQAHDLGARIIVVGRGRHGVLERLTGGESVLRLLQLGETPVLAVDPSLERLPRRVVVATDFSAFSIYAAQVALGLCAPDATVELVHVAPTLSDHDPVQRSFSAQYRAQVQSSFVAMTSRLQQPGITFETTLLEGNASTRLLDHLSSRPADLVVTATHGYGFFRRMLLGSVAAELVRSAPCSVLCVPGTARTLAASRAQAAASQGHTQQLPLESLDVQLAAFTARHRGHACTVEVNQRDLGAQSIGHHLPLAGVTYEAGSRTLTLMFGASADPAQHLAHQIRGCEAVEVLSDAGGRERVLGVRYAGGQTIVQLE